jgi:hypothetical protein
MKIIAIACVHAGCRIIHQASGIRHRAPALNVIAPPYLYGQAASLDFRQDACKPKTFSGDVDFRLAASSS